MEASWRGLVGHRQEVAERAVAAAEGAQALLDAGDQVEQRLEPIAADGGAGLPNGWALSRRQGGRVRVQLGAGQTGLDQDRLHLGLDVDVPPLLLAALDHVEGGLGHVEVPLGDKSRHLPVEESHQQGPDMGTVDIGVAHHHDLAVSPPGRFLFLADAVADRRDDVADLLVAQHAIEPSALDVEDLAPEGEDRLVDPVAAPLGRPAG